MSYSYDTERPNLFTEHGMKMVQAVTAESVRLCRLAGAVRADKAWGTVSGDSWLMLASLDYLVETKVLREASSEDAIGQHRVFMLNEHGPYGGARRRPMTSTVPDLPVPFASIDALESADLTYTDETPEDAVRAIAAPMIAAELRRLRAEYDFIPHAAVFRKVLANRADELDPL